MAKAKFSQPVLNAEQQAEAALMASKATRHIFGETEYEIRDRVHALAVRSDRPR
jgi:hypothetical protein